MLAIRMQRLGRKGHPTYRVVVQDVRQTPTSGKYVALLGSYDPHSKTTSLVKDKAEFYLANGAQPSDRVIRLFTSEGIKLPEWVKKPPEHKREIRNSDKLRRNQPNEEAPAEEPAQEPAAAEETQTDSPTEEVAVSETSPDFEADTAEQLDETEASSEPASDESNDTPKEA
jgi:small subunit ribosomal protein S16